MEVLELGLKEYRETWALQSELVCKRAEDQIPDTLILVEHPAVYTVGRGGGQSGQSIEVPKLGVIPVIEIERGGKLTFHGPGQLVGYPIFKLIDHDLRHYLREMERILMSAISEHTLLPAKPCPETLLLEPGQFQTGVWIYDRKIASIGVAVKRWVTYHGFALNISPDMSYFKAIEPCGFPSDVMTSLEKELGTNVDLSLLSDRICKGIVQKFSALSSQLKL